MIPYKNIWYQLNIGIPKMTIYRKNVNFRSIRMQLKAFMLNMPHYETLAFYPNTNFQFAVIPTLQRKAKKYDSILVTIQVSLLGVRILTPSLELEYDTPGAFELK